VPISAANAKRYPANWRALRAAVLERAGNCCEGSPAYPDCRVPNGAWRVRETGMWSMDLDACVQYAEEDREITRVVLTIAHLDHDELETQDISRLRAWCQKCHLTYDAKHHAQNARQTRHARKAIGELFTQ